MNVNKILIIGPLGAGKSTLAYEINKHYSLPRLNLDEVARNPKSGDYYPKQVQAKTLQHFLKNNSSWVIEGCQKELYEQTNSICAYHASWRFGVLHSGLSRQNV